MRSGWAISGSGERKKQNNTSSLGETMCDRCINTEHYAVYEIPINKRGNNIIPRMRTVVLCSDCNLKWIDILCKRIDIQEDEEKYNEEFEKFLRLIVRTPFIFR